MKPICQIGNETVSSEEFIKFLKLTNEFPDLIRKFIRCKIAVQEAKQNNIEPAPEDIQQAADDFRRCFGLHSAKDTFEWMEKIGIEPDDFEAFIIDYVYQKKIESRIAAEEAIETYFRMNASKFEKADIRRMVVENEKKAKELAAQLADKPDAFEHYVKKYSSDDSTRRTGGLITGLRRGFLPDDIDAKVFGGCQGDIIGPFRVNGSGSFEIICVDALHPAQLDDSAKETISGILQSDWLQQRLKEYGVSSERDI